MGRIAIGLMESKVSLKMKDRQIDRQTDKT